MKKLNIKPQELCERLFKGESFYDLDSHRLYIRSDVFAVEYPSGGSAHTNINLWFAKDIYAKPQWTDNLSEENPVLCWVREIGGTVLPVIINGVDGKFFRDTRNKLWNNAEPVKLEDACIWEES